MILSNSQVRDISELENKAKTWQSYVSVEDLSVQLIKCYKGQLYINIQDKATSVIAIVPK